jgi:hypothetical protein
VQTGLAFLYLGLDLVPPGTHTLGRRLILAPRCRL